MGPVELQSRDPLLLSYDITRSKLIVVTNNTYSIVFLNRIPAPAVPALTMALVKLDILQKVFVVNVFLDSLAQAARKVNTT